MPLLCKDCGNKTRFEEKGNETGCCSIYRSASSYIDQDGSETDFDGYGDTEYGDESWDGDFEVDGDIECCECGSCVEDVSQQEWDDWEEGCDANQQVEKEAQPNIMKELKNKLVGE